MKILDGLAGGLAWLGRRGPRALAALVVLGIATPLIGAQLKPFISEAVFLLLCVAFLLVDTAAFRLYLRRPAIVLAATAWTSLAIPALAGASFLALGLGDRSPDLFLALVLQAIASPLMAAPAFAALMGLDATLVLCTMVASTALLPVTAPVFAHAFIGPALTLSPSASGSSCWRSSRARRWLASSGAGSRAPPRSSGTGTQSTASTSSSCSCSWRR